MRKAFKRLRAVLDLSDVFAITGASFLFYGVHRIYPPAAYILAGLVMMAAAFVMAKPASEETKKDKA